MLAGVYGAVARWLSRIKAFIANAFATKHSTGNIPSEVTFPRPEDGSFTHETGPIGDGFTQGKWARDEVLYFPESETRSK